MKQNTELKIDESREALKGFRDYYVREIEPWMAEQVKKQQDASRWGVIVIAAGGVITGISVWLLFRHVGPIKTWGDWYLLPTVLLATTGVTGAFKLFNLKGEVKEFLLSKVCGFFGFKYNSSVADVGIEDFTESGLLVHHHSCDLEDHIRGCHNGVDFDLFECRLNVEKRDGDGHRSSKEVYHGILFRLAFPKRFNGRTLVLKDRGLIANFRKNPNITGERVKLEDPRFEKKFDVWGTDQIEARYLLTPTFMERIVDLAEAIDSKRLELCFTNNLLIVSSSVTKDQFEGGGIFTHVNDKRRVEQLLTEFCRLFDIVDTLQLTLKTRV